MRALGGERGCGFVAEAGVGSGDDGRAAGLVRNAVVVQLVMTISYNRLNGACAPFGYDYTERAPRLSIPEV